jgi:hypothetical protein
MQTQQVKSNAVAVHGAGFPGHGPVQSAMQWVRIHLNKLQRPILRLVYDADGLCELKSISVRDPRRASLLHKTDRRSSATIRRAYAHALGTTCLGCAFMVAVLTF